MSASKPREPQRIAKLLARAGIASRREIERMIAEGRVALDGKPLDTPATLLPSLRGVTVDGNPVKAPAPARLFRFHKPQGLLTAASDPQGRATIYDRLPRDLPRLMPVGRLDLNTEGLLLMTTDGELKRTLELPATGVERSYRARAYGEVSQAQLEDLIDGIEIDGVRYGSIDANLERRTGANVWIELTLTEGKNREVRRVLEHLGLKVSRLIRTRYGPFWLGDLPGGAVDEIRQHDVIAFRKALERPGGGKTASNLQLTHQPYAPLKAPEKSDSDATRPANRQARRAAAAAADAHGKDAPAKARRAPTEKRDAGKSTSSPRTRSGAHRPASKKVAAPTEQWKPEQNRHDDDVAAPAKPGAKPKRWRAAKPAAAGKPQRPARPERDAGEKLLDRPQRGPRKAADGSARPKRPRRPLKPKTRI